MWRLPFSLAGRLARGQSKLKMTAHALWRSVVLVFLGVFLRSRGSSQTNFTFEDTLSQIGLGYTFLFVLALCSRRVQWAALAVILVGYWAAFAVYPLPGPAFDFAAVGVPSDWPHHPAGFAAHWDKNSNLAWAFDTWFLNLFSRQGAVHAQRRRLCDAELHPHAGDDDPGPTGRRRFATLIAGLGQDSLALCGRLRRPGGRLGPG